MRRVPWLLTILAACSSQSADGGSPDTGAVTTLGGTNKTSATTGGDDDGQDTEPDDGDSSGGDGPGDDNSGDGPQTKFDIGAGGNIFCASKTAGIYCDGATSVLCDDAGQVEDTTNCTPDLCIEGEGCVVCVDGQFACHGPRVMSCDTVGAASWQEVELCDPSINEVCDVGLGTCTALAPIGGTEPTGVYYRYALYTPTEGFTQISDVDSYGNRIYFIAMQGGTLVLGSYDVELLDTDGDGQFEPNQHPDNPDETGPVEERAFTFVEAVPITVGGAFPNVMELYATETKVYYTGTDGLYEYDLATGTVVLTTTFPSWLAGGGFSGMSFLGYDDVNEIWYSGNEAARRVFQYDAASSSWGWSFEYPVLAGSHMDGLEVVTQPGTGIPFVYVSDMTSNFIGQYRLDPAQGWVQENLFSYIETTGALVEGFGYGALGHFWVGSLANTFYELGGGDLTDFIGPEG